MTENIHEIRCVDYSAKINLSRGANCFSLRNRKYKANLLREPDYSKELDNPYLYGIDVNRFNKVMISVVCEHIKMYSLLKKGTAYFLSLQHMLR